MMRIISILFVALTVVSCTPQTSDEDSSDLLSTEAKLKAQNSLKERHDEMVSVLGLDSSESSALEKILTNGTDSIGVWLEGDKGHRLMALESQMKQLSANSDLAGIRKVIAEATPLRKEIVQLIKDSNEQLLNSLGQERRLEWEGYELGEALLELMGPLALNGEQVASIKEAAVEFYRRASNAGEVNPRAAGYLELEAWTEKNVLSEKQFQAFQKIKKSKPLRSLH